MGRPVPPAGPAGARSLSFQQGKSSNLFPGGSGYTGNSGLGPKFKPPVRATITHFLPEKEKPETHHAQEWSRGSKFPRKQPITSPYISRPRVRLPLPFPKPAERFKVRRGRQTPRADTPGHRVKSPSTHTLGARAIGNIHTRGMGANGDPETTKPGGETTEPGKRGTQGTRNPDPETRNQDPGTLDPGTWNLDPNRTGNRTQNLELELAPGLDPDWTWNLDPEQDTRTPDPGPGTQEPEPGTRNRTRESGIRIRIGNRDRNRKPKTGTRTPLPEHRTAEPGHRDQRHRGPGPESRTPRTRERDRAAQLGPRTRTANATRDAPDTFFITAGGGVLGARTTPTTPFLTKLTPGGGGPLTWCRTTQTTGARKFLPNGRAHPPAQLRALSCTHVVGTSHTGGPPCSTIRTHSPRHI